MHTYSFLLKNVPFLLLCTVNTSAGPSSNKASTTRYAQKMAKAHLKSNGMGMYAPNKKISEESKKDRVIH